jgi:hypothetical protein
MGVCLAPSGGLKSSKSAGFAGWGRTHFAEKLIGRGGRWPSPAHGLKGASGRGGVRGFPRAAGAGWRLGMRGSKTAFGLPDSDFGVEVEEGVEAALELRFDLLA